MVATADLPAGHRLVADDLRIVAMDPAAAASNAAADPDSFIGKNLAVPIAEGEAVTAPRIIGAAGGARAGMLATSIRLADPASTDMLTTGSLIDVLAASGGIDDGLGPAPAEAARIVASGIRILGIPRTTSTGSGLLGGSTSSTSTGLVLVEVDRATARALAGAAASARLSVAVRTEGKADDAP